MSGYAFWEGFVAAFALAWAVPVAVVAASDLFGEGGLFRRRPPEAPDAGALAAARRVRAARETQGDGGQTPEPPSRPPAAPRPTGGGCAE